VRHTLFLYGYQASDVNYSKRVKPNIYLSIHYSIKGSLVTGHIQLLLLYALILLMNRFVILCSQKKHSNFLYTRTARNYFSFYSEILCLIV